MTKFKNKPVYACPNCWRKPQKDNHSDTVLVCSCFPDWVKGKNCKLEIFDSKAEHARGLELKPLEAAGIITGLRHHEVFKLWPRLYGETWIRKETGTRIFSVSDVKDDTFDGAIEIPHKFEQWESDFIYQIETLHKHFKGEIIVEEIKRLSKKEITQTLTDAKTGEKYKQKIMIDFPYFVSPADLSHFKKVCEFMLAIHGHKVQVRAGGQLWMFNAKWELERVSR